MSHWPHLSLLYSTARREPTSCVGLDVPDQDASQGVREVRWARLGWDQPSILSIDLILYLSTLYILFLFIFHHRSMHRAASSSRSVADRFNSYNTRLCSEIDSLALGPILFEKHRLYHKPMLTVCSLYTLGGKPLIRGSANTCLSFIFTMHFNHDSGLSPLQRITLCQCVWHHTWLVVIGAKILKWLSLLSTIIISGYKLS